MKYLILFLFGFVFFITDSSLYAQDSLTQKIICPSGLSFEYGIGTYAVTDEYISKEKYSGFLPLYETSWIKQHEKYLYHLSMSYQYSSEIKNYNVRANIHQFTLNQGFKYPLSPLKLFDNEVYIYLGPASELFFYYNKQRIAVSGFNYSQSGVLLISGSLNTNVYYKLSENLNLEGTMNFGVLAFAFRMVDAEESDESPVKILTLVSGTNIDFRFGTRYYLFDNLSLKAAYLFRMARITSWDTLLSASDYLLLGFTYGF